MIPFEVDHRASHKAPHSIVNIILCIFKLRINVPTMNQTVGGITKKDKPNGSTLVSSFFHSISSFFSSSQSCAFPVSPYSRKKRLNDQACYVDIYGLSNWILVNKTCNPTAVSNIKQ